MISTAFMTFAGIVALADIFGQGHDWGGMALAVAWFWFCRTLGPRGWSMLLAGSLGLSVAIAALAVAQVIYAGHLVRAIGPFASPNFLGAYAVLQFFIAIIVSPGGRHAPAPVKAGAFCVGANILTLALSQSRGAILALGAGLAVLVLSRKEVMPHNRKPPHVRRNKATALALAGAALLIVILIRPGLDEPRLAIWRLGIQAASQRLVLGWGQGGLVVDGLDRFYSVPLEWLIAGGMPCVLAGVWLFIAAWRAGKPLDEGGPHLRPFLAAWFVQGLFLFGTPATAIPFVAVLAYLTSGGGKALRQDVPRRAAAVDGDEKDLRARGHEAVGAG